MITRLESRDYPLTVRLPDHLRARFQADLVCRFRPCDLVADPAAPFTERLHELELLYSATAHRLRPDFLEAYARKHMEALLQRRDEILRHFREFHQDRDFIAYLRQYAPQLYDHARWEVWALAIAERLEVEPASPEAPPPARQPLTPEEKQAKIERYRQRHLDRKRVQVEDRIADVKQRLDLLHQFRSELAQYELEEDEAMRLEREFAAELFTDEEVSDAAYRRL